MKASLWSVVTLTLWRCPPSWRRTPPATSCRPATTAACRSRRTRPTSSRSTTGSRRCATTSPTTTSTSTSCPRTSSRSAPPPRRSPAAPGSSSIYDAYGVPHVYGADAGGPRLRRRLGDRPRPRPAAAARPRPGPRRRRRHPRHRRVLAGHERPVVRAERGDRAARHRAGAAASSTPTATRARRSSRDAAGRTPTASTPTSRRNGIDQPPATVNDVIAVTAFIGSIFGAGGGGEAANADPARQAPEPARRRRRATRPGTTSCSPTIPRRRPRSTTALQLRARSPAATVDRARSVVDPGSIQSIDPRRDRRPQRRRRPPARAPRRRTSSSTGAATRSAPARQLARGDGPAARLLLPGDRPADPPPRPGHQGAGRRACPACAMYILIGRTQDYAWSLTSADHDVRDVFAEKLCEPDGATPTRASTHYLFKGECRAVRARSTPATLERHAAHATRVPVHGPVFGTATVDGKPFALSRQRSTFGRDGLNLGALKDMTEGTASTPREVLARPPTSSASRSTGRTRRATSTAYFASGLLPKRARGPRPAAADARHRRVRVAGLPLGAPSTRTTSSGPGRPAAQLEQPVGAGLHARRRRARTARCTASSMFDQFPRAGRSSRDNVGIMNRAATEDVRSPVWPVVSRVLRTGAGAERARPAGRRPARRLGRAATRRGSTPTTTGPTTRPGRRSWTRCGDPVASAVMTPVFGDLRRRPRQRSAASAASTASRTSTRTCARCSATRCRARSTCATAAPARWTPAAASLWAAVDQAADPARRRSRVSRPGGVAQARRARTGFTPGLLPDTFRATNRPTFQQVLEFEPK